MALEPTDSFKRVLRYCLDVGLLPSDEHREFVGMIEVKNPILQSVLEQGLSECITYYFPVKEVVTRRIE
jgi:hypothetical protein